ncbi:MAG: ankyrin repeat domain-containing protein [Candidatus Cardinium sp.]|uniref:ankyrin repeat domain-containing protein n=1 Tax=Cardinium endosymbiont of Dermatophagoides farinae TaxID=2597823 RepID=UPI0011831356|nr:ankyrin repeat domain-containing protein [Cardinium endosymbiont of Dermatophagoides farinae]TSJ80698.1 ankyrin repeat domain-containing protein [Cardinium endosymbiont of Dermatophagoides farinae]UWW96692.1 MAG: ankyrin repeat domain-containing protein [Candidatus Cardinium sp.]
MRRKIKFLLALSYIPLSCTNLTKPTVLNAKEKNEQGLGTVTGYKNKNAPAEQPVQKRENTTRIQNFTRNISRLIDNIIHTSPSQTQIGVPKRYQLLSYILQHLDNIKQHNKVDYRLQSGTLPRNDSLSILYKGQSRQHEKHHNKFFDNIIKLNHRTSRLYSQIKNLLALAVFSKSPKVVLKFIRFLTSENIKVNIHAKDLFGISVLDYAMASGHKEMVQALIKYGRLVHIRRKDPDLDLPALLGKAICLGTPEIIGLLIDAGADLINWVYNGERADEHGNGLRRIVSYDRKDIAMHLIKNNRIKNLDEK